MIPVRCVKPMPSVQRDREWGEVVPRGINLSSSYVFNNNEPHQISRHRCKDVAGNHDGVNNLLISHFEVPVFKPMNGVQLNPSGQVIRRMENYYPQNLWPNNTALQHMNVDLSPWAATELASRSNPSRPEVQLPVSLVELRELPSLIRHAGRQLRPNGRPKNLPRNLAEANLVWQFGWAPLLGDVNKLLQFSDHVDKRVGELKKLTTSTGLRRRIKLGQGVVSDTVPNYVIQSANTVVTVRKERSTSYIQWGTIRWKSNELLGASDAKLKKYARKALLGLGTDPSSILSTAWELLPWSWLIDYFGNVGDYLQAHSNSVPATPSGICVMTTKNTTCTLTPNTHSWVTGGHAVTSYITKERDIRGAALAAKLPFLSGRQMSILGSLAVVRSKFARR